MSTRARAHVRSHTCTHIGMVLVTIYFQNAFYVVMTDASSEQVGYIIINDDDNTRARVRAHTHVRTCTSTHSPMYTW